MRIYLVQSGQSLNGSDGYSYGLLHGGHPRLLVSFVDYMNAKRSAIHSEAQVNRRKLIVRVDDKKAAKARRTGRPPVKANEEIDHD